MLQVFIFSSSGQDSLNTRVLPKPDILLSFNNHRGKIWIYSMLEYNQVKALNADSPLGMDTFAMSRSGSL